MLVITFFFLIIYVAFVIQEMVKNVNGRKLQTILLH